MITMAQGTEPQNYAAFCAESSDKPSCERTYAILSYAIPFTSVTAMYLLSEIPIHEPCIVPCCLASGVLAGTSGYLLYKAVKFLVHKVRAH